MYEALIQTDHQLFFEINGGWAHPWLDMLMPWLRNKLVWVPLYLFVFVFLIVNYQRRAVFPILFAVLTITISDQLSSHVIKPAVDRDRPCQHEILQEEVRLLVPCGGGKSFTSSHATNHFAIALFFGLFFWKRWRWVLPAGILWAGTVSLAQVYVGLHFPADITGGALLGSLVGGITAEGERWARGYFMPGAD